MGCGQSQFSLIYPKKFKRKDHKNKGKILDWSLVTYSHFTCLERWKCWDNNMLMLDDCRISYIKVGVQLPTLLMAVAGVSEVVHMFTVYCHEYTCCTYPANMKFSKNPSWQVKYSCVSKLSFFPLKWRTSISKHVKKFTRVWLNLNKFLSYRIWYLLWKKVCVCNSLTYPLSFIGWTIVPAQV